MIHITWIEYDDILESILWDSAKDLVSKISMRVKHRASKAILDVTLYEELKETGLSVPGLAENIKVSSSVETAKAEWGRLVAVIRHSVKADLRVIRCRW
jgi:hypothetical protein